MRGKEGSNEHQHRNPPRLFCLCALIVSSEIVVPKQPPRDPLLQLVSLQKAPGCWEMNPDLAAALGKTSEEVEKPKPESVGYRQK